MNCTEPVPAGSWLSPIRPAFTSNQAAAVAAGPSRDRTALQVSAMKLPKPIRERPSIAGTPRPGPASRRSHPIPPPPARPRHKRPKGRVMPERLLTVQEAGEMLNTGERFPRRLIAERRIRFVRVGRHVRIPESAIADYVAAQTVEAMRLRGMR